MPKLRDLIDRRLRRPRRKFDGPVAWLFGRQLIGSLRGILLYAAYGKKIDPRDWMEAHVFPSADLADAMRYWESSRPPGSSADEFWFDYIADSGDGMTATYSVAYLTTSNLYVETRDDDRLRQHPAASFASKPGCAELLPRGQFLFVGGDTSYHVSDYITLATRFQLPFVWAEEDHARHAPDDRPHARRPLFGIPGNHDYYDQLDGFRRQFRQTVLSEERSTTGAGSAAASPEQLSIPGYERCQNASYLALRLPFGWWLWGLDTEVGQIDERQQKFFIDLCKGSTAEPVPPDKLILATCAPTTAFGKLASVNDKKAYDAIKQLGLSTPFLETRDADGHVLAPGDAQMKRGQCRLDLSGDVHQYARYWGPARPGVPARAHARTPPPAADSYASVVSGLGGAFHHPTRTYVDEVQEQALYPGESVSTEKVATRLLGFLHIWRGGFVWLAGAIVAFVLTFAAYSPQSSREFITYFLPAHLGLAPEAPTIRSVIGDATTVFDLSRPLPPDQAGALLLLMAAPAILLFLTFSNSVFHRKRRGSIGADQKVPVGSSTRGPQKMVDPETSGEPEPYLWWGTFAAVGAMVIGLVLLRPHRTTITPFGNSFVTLATLIWMAATLALTLRYAEFLFKKSHRAFVRRRDWALTWVLIVAGVIVGASGLWVFGKNNLPALLTSDIAFIVVFVGTAAGLTALPFVAGADLFYGRSVVAQRSGKLAIGVWHAALQLLVPFVLIRRGSLVTLVAAVVVVWLGSACGERLMKRDRPLTVVVAWAGYGALLLALPWLTTGDAFLRRPIFPYGDWLGIRGFVPAAVASLCGAMTACSLLGWYLAVCFMYNGHNNEVGGAAQIEEFKEFVRICLRPDGLTAYVIGIDKPARDGSKLKPRIVDVFSLRTK